MIGWSTLSFKNFILAVSTKRMGWLNSNFKAAPGFRLERFFCLKTKVLSTSLGFFIVIEKAFEESNNGEDIVALKILEEIESNQNSNESEG